MFDKTYRPSDIEPKQYQRWEESGHFSGDPTSSALPFTIMMPPPNVTGHLHIGHAFNLTMQDILIRYHRMRGRDAFWQPGTDHAGIATQMVVERQLEKEGLTRNALGPKAFVDRVWKWKEYSSTIIEQQLRRLGLSADWLHQKFTLDEDMNRAVIEVFVQLYHAGLIYKDKHLVNWDPKLCTALSDLEIEFKEVSGPLWYIRYLLDSDPNQSIVIATGRPETLFGDTAIAIHPDDQRYHHLIGQKAIVPLVNRQISIIVDEAIDPKIGSGAVKITPAHDFTDFEIGKRHNLERIMIFDQTACLNESVPESYRGLDRFSARERVIDDLIALNLLVKKEPHVSLVPYGDRSGTPIEPFLTDQWFCDAKQLAPAAIKAVEEGRTTFVPRHWEEKYFSWLKNIQPWCISRQLWWGHQIPAWYGPDGRIFVAPTEEQAQKQATAYYQNSQRLIRDPDVLDTWFSSALWPFMTLGWPDETPYLRRYYPGDILVTSFDIIFFWVARMMMMSLYFMDDVPFRTVYIHALVRDEKGQKMSKSKNNIIDPLELIDHYGCDAMRFTLASLAAQGRPINLIPSQVEGYRNFTTKLWNATRYIVMQGGRWHSGFDPSVVKQTINRWIIAEIITVSAKVTDALDDLRINDAAYALYQFTWGKFCDWYIEFTKLIFTQYDLESQEETRSTAVWVLGQVLHLLHPLMPFITEELWSYLSEEDQPYLIITSAWPRHDELVYDSSVVSEVTWMMDLISTVRSIRAQQMIPSSMRLDLMIKDLEPQHLDYLDTQRIQLLHHARLKTIGPLVGPIPQDALQSPFGSSLLILSLDDRIDVAQERMRLTNALKKTTNEIVMIDRLLNNETFLSRAPEKVIVEKKERHLKAKETRRSLQEALDRLSVT